MKFHEETLTRRLLAGGGAQRRSDSGFPLPKKNPLNDVRKPYVYGQSKLSLRPTV